MTCGRRPIEKARGQFPGAGFENSCDDDDMPVICPTCQIFCVAVASALLFKSLYWRRGFLLGKRLRGSDRWRRNDFG